MQRQGRDRNSPRRLWVSHVIGVALLVALPNLAMFGASTGLLRPLGLSAHRPRDAATKIAKYSAATERYDVVFVGDSRTFCAFDPEKLDPLLGRRTVNLAYWAQWLPTQYPSFQDLIPLLTPNTTVVWSIGHQNFKPVFSTVNNAYPIGLANAARYLGWGFRWPEIQDNLAASWFNVLPLYRYRAAVPAIAGRLLARGGNLGKPLENAERYEALRAELIKDPGVEEVRPMIDVGMITSAEVFKVAGNYTRIELAPAYFRRRQREAAALLHPSADPFSANPEYWELFVASLDLFRKAGVRLVINEIEEAPYQYDIPENAKHYREFMRGVRSFVESQGIPYVRVSWESFSDEDYFDYNHLNARGIDRFSPLFAEQVRPYLP